MKDRTKLTVVDKKLLAKEARNLAAERKLLNRKWAKEILLVLEMLLRYKRRINTKQQNNN